MFKTYEKHRQVAVAAAEQAFGSVQHVSDTCMLFQSNGWQFEIILRGADYRDGGSVPYQVMELRLPLTVPIKFGIHERNSYVHMGPVPLITTGDPGFDAAWAVKGVPREVVQHALDETVRLWLHRVQQHAGPHLMLQTDESGALTFNHSISLPHEKRRWPLTPELLSTAAEAMCRFANNLEATYRARREDIVAREGEAAALAWEGQNQQVSAARPLGWVRWVLVTFLVLSTLLILAITALFVLWMMQVTG